MTDPDAPVPVILCAGSTNHHFEQIITPLVRIRRAVNIPVVYGGAIDRVWSERLPNGRWIHTLPRHARHIREYARPPLRVWSRRAWLEYACVRAIRAHRADCVLITSYRYNLERAMVAASKREGIPSVCYFSTRFMEATVQDGQRNHGPRMQFYDIPVTQLWTVNLHLKEQLAAHGVA
jgi:hypothetical protein